MLLFLVRKGAIAFNQNGTRFDNTIILHQYRTEGEWIQNCIYCQLYNIIIYRYWWSKKAHNSRSCHHKKWNKLHVSTRRVNRDNLARLVWPNTSCVIEKVIILLILISDDSAPYDGTPREVLHLNHVSLVVIYSIFASAGLVFTIVCLLFTLIFREKRYLRHYNNWHNFTSPMLFSESWSLSSPNLNFLIIAGAARSISAGIAPAIVRSPVIVVM